MRLSSLLLGVAAVMAASIVFSIVRDGVTPAAILSSMFTALIAIGGLRLRPTS
jgi:hypothetical protein